MYDKNYTGCTVHTKRLSSAVLSRNPNDGQVKVNTLTDSPIVHLAGYTIRDMLWNDAIVQAGLRFKKRKR